MDDLSQNIQFGYDKILRFLSRRKSGYIFALADDYRFIHQINNALVSDLGNKGRKAGILFLNGKSDEPLLYQIKQHCEGNGALIIANLYEIINDEAAGRNNLSHLNFSREELHDLALPLLFWADKKSIGSITNNAPDLFSQRSFTTVHFTGQVEHPVEEAFEKEDWKEFISTDKFKEIEARIETLKRRLHDAEAAGYHPARIASEIALPLAREYAELGSNEKAENILFRYQHFIKEDNAEQLKQLAWIYYYLHNYGQAISFLQRANAVLEKFGRLPETWFYNNLQTADLLTEYGKPSEARELLQKTEINIEKEKSNYSNLITDDIISLITERLGDISRQTGNLQEAKDYYQQSLTIRTSLSNNNPHSEKFKRNLGISYEMLGDISRQTGNLQEAKDYYQQSLTIRTSLSNNNPHSEELKRDLSVSYERLGNITQQVGNLQEAKEYYGKYLQISKTLGRSNPHSEGIKRDLGVSYNKLGDIAQQAGDVQEAKDYYKHGLSVSEALVKANPHSEGFKRDLGISFFYLASIAEEEQQFTEALHLFSNALSIFQPLSAANSLSQQLKDDIKITEQRINSIHQQLHPTQQ